MKTQFELHGLTHACESMPCGKTERNINARALTNYFSESDKITESKLKICISGGLRKGKTYFFGVSVCLRFEWLVEFVQMKTTHSLQVVVAQKEVSRFSRKCCKRILMRS